MSIKDLKIDISSSGGTANLSRQVREALANTSGSRDRLEGLVEFVNSFGWSRSFILELHMHDRRDNEKPYGLKLFIKNSILHIIYYCNILVDAQNNMELPALLSPLPSHIWKLDLHQKMKDLLTTCTPR